MQCLWLPLLAIAGAVSLATPSLSQTVASQAAQSQAAPALPPPMDATRLERPLDLSGTWLVHAGDNLAYADPHFDDSAWTRFDPYASLPAVIPEPYPDVVWYRTRVRVDPAERGIALREQAISEAFEVYVNGEKLLESGQVAPFHHATVGALRLAPIPDSQMATGMLLVAIRAHISQREWKGTQNPGYYATNLTLGSEQTLDQQDWLTVIGDNLLHWIDLFLLVSVGVVGVVLFQGQRGQKEYLWLAAVALISLCQLPYQVAAIFHDIPVRWQILSGLAPIASPYCWVALYFSFVGVRIGWRLSVYLVVAGVLNGYTNLDNLFSTLPGGFALLSNLPYVTLLSIVIPIVLAVHFRRGNREAGILLIPVILFSLYIYAKFSLSFLFNFPVWKQFAIQGFQVIDNSHAGPIKLGLNQVSGILSTLTLAIIMLQRSSEMSRRQAQLEGELAAAQQVQQVLVPEQIESIPGYVVETAYEPAQQVGGDFFQIISVPQNGVLLVVGDVAGKGLPAAMLVSLLVGAIRTAAEDTHSPEKLLHRLNERLFGRSSGGFSTALAAHISANGSVTMANAGHLSPYLDGREIELPGALPLGLVSDAHYEITRLELAPGSRLTFYSDGVIEAQNAKGELFGFKRGQEISTQPAAAIVDAAKRFGQSDDITVVAITREAVAWKAA
jgi:hypothetical protein